MSDIFGFDDVLERSDRNTSEAFTGEDQVMNNELINEPADESSPYGEQTNDDEMIADFLKVTKMPVHLIVNKQIKFQSVIVMKAVTMRKHRARLSMQMKNTPRNKRSQAVKAR